MAKKPTGPRARLSAADIKRLKEAAATESRNAQAARQELVPIVGTGIVPDARYDERSLRAYGQGPWKDESTKVAWTDPATGYPCIILRQRTGELGGYVGVEPSHVLAGWMADALPGSINVGLHQNVSYSAACQEKVPERMSICHVPPRPIGPSQDQHREKAQASAGQDHGADLAWWFGMVMNGPQDYVPRLATSGVGSGRGPIYRDEAFVCAQVTALAGKLKAIDDLAKGGSASTADPASPEPVGLPAPRLGGRT